MVAVRVVGWAAARLHGQLEELESIAGRRAGRLEDDLFERADGDGVPLTWAGYLGGNWGRHGTCFSPHLHLVQVIVVRTAQTADDMPPGAELFGAALPSDDGMLSGERSESAYSLLGGVVLNCPARRQWTMRGN